MNYTEKREICNQRAKTNKKERKNTAGRKDTPKQ